MIRRSLCCLIGALVFGAAFAEAARSELPSPLIRQDRSERLEDYAFEERAASGERIERAFIEYRGRPLVAIAWATWCAVCQRELPRLDELAAELGPDGLRVIALSIDDGGYEVAERALRERGLSHLQLAHDTKKMFFATIGAFGVPTTVIADADGRIVARANGPVDWEAPEVRALLRSLLPARQPR